jgi:hypothetical protein
MKMFLRSIYVLIQSKKGVDALESSSQKNATMYKILSESSCCRPVKMINEEITSPFTCKIAVGRKVLVAVSLASWFPRDWRWAS